MCHPTTPNRSANTGGGCRTVWCTSAGAGDPPPHSKWINHADSIHLSSILTRRPSSLTVHTTNSYTLLLSVAASCLSSSHISCILPATQPSLNLSSHRQARTVSRVLPRRRRAYRTYSTSPPLIRPVPSHPPCQIPRPPRASTRSSSPSGSSGSPTCAPARPMPLLRRRPPHPPARITVSRRRRCHHRRQLRAQHPRRRRHDGPPRRPRAAEGPRHRCRSRSTPPTQRMITSSPSRSMTCRRRRRSPATLSTGPYGRPLRR